MDNQTRNVIAEALKTAPVWARLALTSQKDALVDRAADTMAALIVHRLSPKESEDDRQLVLPIR